MLLHKRASSPALQHGTGASTPYLQLHVEAQSLVHALNPLCVLCAAGAAHRRAEQRAERGGVRRLPVRSRRTGSAAEACRHQLSSVPCWTGIRPKGVCAGKGTALPLHQVMVST